MALIDSHSHIYLPDFDQDRAKMLERAENEGVTRILLPAIDSATHDAMLSTELAFQGFCISMMGVHPCSVNQNFKNELQVARDHFEKRNFIAVGETGLDFYWDKTYTSQQYEAFHTQIDWALEYDIPVVIHSRDATSECIEVVAGRQKGALKGVFHCFSGTAEQAKTLIDLGFYLGIGGVLTFKNAGLDKVMQGLDLERIVLETDAPYLAPVPFRGKRNEPSYLKYVVEKLSQLKNCTVEDVKSITTANAVRLFGYQLAD